MSDDGPNVRAKVKTLEAGDRIFTPRGRPAGYVVLRLEGPYDDGTVVVVYRGPMSGWDGRATALGDGEVSLRPMLPDERVPARRAGQ